MVGVFDCCGPERPTPGHCAFPGVGFPEVSTKTIQRDNDFMRDRLGLPIEYDQLHFGFVYTEPVTHFPNVEVF